VFNTISATLILGETFTRNSFIGTVLVCIGAVLIATFGAVNEPAHSLDELLELLDQRPFIVWMIMTGLVVALVLAGSRIIKVLSASGNSKLFRSIHLSRSFVSPSHAKFYRGLAFAFCSGVLSAHTLLLAKSAVELLVRTIVDHVNQFNRWQSWMILIGIVFLALTQLYYMHLSLKLCSTSVLYPFVFCVYNIVAILDGLIYFRQASQLAGLHAGLIALGTVVLLGGVLFLSWRLEDSDSHHPSIAVPNASQTPLGPGMSIVEEYAESPEDEEMQVGERQPLLSKSSSRHETSHKRTPSLPLIPTHRYRAQTVDARAFNTESAQIWAELDDSENEVDENRTSMDSSPTRKRISQYPRRRTFSLLSEDRGQRWPLAGDDDARLSIRIPKSRNTQIDSPSALSRWSPRWLQHQRQNTGLSRRTSAPVSLGRRLGYSKSPKPDFNSTATHHSNGDSTAGSARNYGATSVTEDGGLDSADTANGDNHSPNPETILRRGLRLVHRWTGISGPERNQEDSENPPV
jgi:magnesium transporter